MVMFLAWWRWILVLIAGAFLLVALATTLVVPGWISYPYRLLITGMVGERGYRFVLVPLIIAFLGWRLRRNHRALSRGMLICGLVTFGLMLKPVVQAWRLGKTLPAQLSAAFGPADPRRAPFSIPTLFAAMPEPVQPQELIFAGKLKLEFYRAVGRSPAPCVISLHGGGWFSGGHRDRRPFTFWMARQGYAVATVGYRLLPQARWPMQRWDVLGAVAYLREHAAELGIDPDRIVLLGRSAGAQLAEASAYGTRDQGIRGVIAFYGPSDLADMWDRAAGSREQLNGWTPHQLLEQFLGGTPATAQAAYANASGLSLVNAASPPTLLIHGALDSMIPLEQSQRLAAKLTAAGRPNALVVVPWASHAFDTLNFNGPGSQISEFSIAWFLEAVTR
ncbi:MAG TPA: alpha/beta hydrolase [Opitutaceae bacterium]|nr:alpha/beta hydrolase [Opitutaceae bacterium]